MSRIVGLVISSENIELLLRFRPSKGENFGNFFRESGHLGQILDAKPALTKLTSAFKGRHREENL
jgi:hypothetical protein